MPTIVIRVGGSRGMHVLGGVRLRPGVRVGRIGAGYALTHVSWAIFIAVCAKALVRGGPGLPAFLFVALVGSTKSVAIAVAAQCVAWRRSRAVDSRAVRCSGPWPPSRSPAPRRAASASRSDVYSWSWPSRPRRSRSSSPFLPLSWPPPSPWSWRRCSLSGCAKSGGSRYRAPAHGQGRLSGPSAKRWRGHGSPAIQVRFSRFRSTVQQDPVKQQETQIVQSCMTLGDLLPGFASQAIRRHVRVVTVCRLPRWRSALKPSQARTRAPARQPEGSIPEPVPESWPAKGDGACGELRRRGIAIRSTPRGPSAAVRGPP